VLVFLPLVGPDFQQVVRIAHDRIVRTQVGEFPCWVVQGDFQTVAATFNLDVNAGLNDLVDDFEQLLAQCRKSRVLNCCKPDMYVRVVASLTAGSATQAPAPFPPRRGLG